uniref:Reverse transcriptase domain-containing protein n=1 Tax=Tanacetum cinerariifolium TaxID=118510 RepID=A0A6L2MYR7_TANCI|nr:reverse transcriptase domain-containing protein [Tanacetum cinerariifolium]
MTPRYKNEDHSGQFGTQRTVNVAGTREKVGSPVVQKCGIQFFNCKEYGHFAKECRKPKRVKDSAYHKEKMLLCKQAEQGVPLQAEQYDWLVDTDEKVDEQELEAHYSYMAKIQEVPTIDSSTDSELVEQVQNDAGYNVFANVLQHSKQSELVSNTCLVETDDCNVIPDSLDMCEDDIQNDQNDVESEDERVALANLIANLKLYVDENKKTQKQLKKANTTLAQELKECKAILAETSKSLGESISVRDSCLVALQNKQAGFEKFKAFNDRTIDYDKLKRKLNEALAQLGHKDTVIREGLKTKAYELSVVKEKHDELMKQSLLTKSHYDGQVKQKTKVITDLKLRDEHDIEKMLSMEKHLKPIPDGEETLALERDSRSKLNKDSVKNDTVCNGKASNGFRKEREQYIKIQDLKAKLQDKNIAISICMYSDAWGLDELEKTLEQIEPYNAHLLALDDIRNRDHTQAIIALMLYCLENRQPFNLAYFIVRRMYSFRDRRDKVLPYGMILTRLFENLKENMTQGSFDERYKLVPRKMSSVKAKQPKRPLPKRTRNLGKSKQTQLTTSSSTESPPSDNRDFPSTKISPRSYHRALKDDPNMSKEQRETRGMFKNSGRALHNFARMLKKGWDAEHYTRAWMNFMIVRSPSLYKGITGRPEIREIQAVPSTTHGMLKFSTKGGIVAIRSTILTPTECTTIVATPKDHAKKAEIRHENFKVAIHPDFPDQEITIGGTRHSPDTGLFCELSARDSQAKLYPNGKASPGASLRSQEATHILPGASHRGHHRPTHQAGQILADLLVEKPDDTPPESSVIETPQEPWTLFTDGSSCVDGSGVRLILTSPEETEFTYALRFQFSASNNEAKYEALIAGLRIAAQIGVRNVHVSVDSKLVANQVLRTYVAKEENMVKYLEKAKSLIRGFTNFSISQVPRSKNKKADALSKISSTSFAHLSKQVLVEVLKEKSIQEEKVAIVVEEEGPTWMTLIMEYLKDETLLGDRKEASKLRIKARQYALWEWVLYMRSFLKPWLRCIGPLQTDYVIREIHKGSVSLKNIEPNKEAGRVDGLIKCVNLVKKVAKSDLDSDSSIDSQMHNNIMEAGSRDRPPMLAPGRYPQWRLRFLRYVDTRPNGEALRKCILSGPYKPATVLVQAVKVTNDSLAVLEHTTVETPANMSPENKAYFLAEKEAIHLILTGIGDDIYSTVDACQQHRKCGKQ